MVLFPGVSFCGGVGLVVFLVRYFCQLWLLFGECCLVLLLLCCCRSWHRWSFVVFRSFLRRDADFWHFFVRTFLSLSFSSPLAFDVLSRKEPRLRHSSSFYQYSTHTSIRQHISKFDMQQRRITGAMVARSTPNAEVPGSSPG